jgi:hypothetical protein
MNIDKHPSFAPVTMSDPKPDTDPLSKPIDFVITNTDRSNAALIACELEAHRRKRNQLDASRAPAGLVVGVASQAEWDAAVAEFRV